MTFYIMAFLFALNCFLFWRMRHWNLTANRWNDELIALNKIAIRERNEARAELAALKAPRKVPARVGCRIGVTHSDIEGDLWRCEETPACDWFWRSTRRPVHTRKQHEKLLQQNTGETP